MHSITDILQNHTRTKTIAVQIQQLKKIHSVWLELIDSNQETAKIDKVLLVKSIPASIHNNTLNISCETNMIAHHFRFAEETVLHLLEKKGIKNILQIRTFVNFQESSFNPEKTSINVHREVHQETILALKQLSTTCQSKELNSSIKKLLTQLRNIK